MYFLIIIRFYVHFIRRKKHRNIMIKVIFLKI